MLSDLRLKELIDLIIQGELNKFYKSKEWQALRQKALKRDKHECQRCKRLGRVTTANTDQPRDHKRKGSLHVHHLKEVKTHPHLALTLDNLETLCRTCHNVVHDRLADHMSKKKKRFMNEERW
ncbi:HNH endonuclease [Jeotgalibacillus haloalkalitolerans]|uniref:HNH endonuclease n=1 Tax=Jeotgalibacillus haloalkalitolerans TaxID=3104292 RepID=A0ABU5KLX6_9BACL|nr:HNH endonuclease [Jeotgalibacillus sp. HH7-29]MDZ5712251.1 HNH endonuclease [Jeotgalibacillus sp. HH7-29]